MADSNPLRLTADDIATYAGRTTMPPILTILPEEVPDVPPSLAAGHRHGLHVSLADVAAFEPAGEEVVSVLELLMHDLVNEARMTHLPRWLGRGRLQWHGPLAQVARHHANDLLNRRYVSHTTPEGISVAQRLDRGRVSYLACGENIGVIYGSASHGERGIREVQKAFMDQPRRLTNHRANILNPMWTHVGIGVAYAPEGQLIVTQNFIATLTSPINTTAT